MCGVIGYVGRREATERLVRGLERLEYRGYDSSGVCLVGDAGLHRVRAVGKLANLRARLAGDEVAATTGVGHTRWATHGRVAEHNAHPLVAGDPGDPDVAIVLNGIVENHGALRRELTTAGCVFDSETDAEVVAHLVRALYRGSLVDAVRAAAERLEGHFAFVAVHRDEPDLLAGARRHCPLVAGLGAGEAWLASSITAFAGDAAHAKVIEDGEIVAVTADGIRIWGPDGEERRRDDLVVAIDDQGVGKGGYERFMLKEIHEQPAAVERTLVRALADGSLAAPRLQAVGGTTLQRILVIACGTSYHAGCVGRHAIEAWAGVPCDVEVASEWRYREPLVADGTLVVGISQSGETADTLAALRLARARGAATLAITNSPASQITREADAVLLTHAGVEVGVAATKTFTTQIALLYLLALRLGGLRGRLAPGEVRDLTAQVQALPAAIGRALAIEGVDEVADRHAERPFFFFIGRQVGLPVCQEGALKLKEITYIPAEAHAAGEMKHGPIALLDEETPVVCVATEAAVAEKLASNLQEVRARGAEVIAVATAGDVLIHEIADRVLVVPRTHPLLQPAVAVVPLQLLAYRIAELRGLDVDQPRNLAKTVTVE